jgi:putative transcriptional regulator
MENRLEELRRKNGWTQQDLADLTGVSRQTIISLEQGRYNPSLQLAFRLARRFGTTIEGLFLFKESEDDNG